MIDLKTIEQIQQAPVVERIQIIELILQSLKQDVKSQQDEDAPHFKPFKVRGFNLGQEVRVDRDSLYADRGL